jgi:multicomponent Na+:H+ antiporter subunit C
MNVALFYALTGAGIFVLGLHGVIIYRHLLRKIMAINIMGSGVFLLLAGLAHRAPAGPPDPVPHAMVITGIVVAVAATALALVLLLRLLAVSGSVVLPDNEEE